MIKKNELRIDLGDTLLVLHRDKPIIFCRDKLNYLIEVEGVRYRLGTRISHFNLADCEITPPELPCGEKEIYEYRENLKALYATHLKSLKDGIETLESKSSPGGFYPRHSEILDELSRRSSAIKVTGSEDEISALVDHLTRINLLMHEIKIWFFDPLYRPSKLLWLEGPGALDFTPDPAQEKYRTLYSQIRKITGWKSSKDKFTELINYI